MKFNKDLFEIIARDKWMMETLGIVRDLGLHDCWIGAGFVRNKVWDLKHGIKRSELNDIDVIYFDKLNCSRKDDLIIESRLKTVKPDMDWSVKNQARMHVRNDHSPYLDCNDAISYWPETATSIAVRLSGNGDIEVIAPYGLDDLFNLRVKPTPKADLGVYENRMQQKQWGQKWSKLIIDKTNSF